ncbi:hypothetical protein MAR_004633 [Mya arenaria]|uniref:Uncharacterized protein n=1 Tax=Mya arenaria TaxID=6604 RepID=A0ABY7F1A2_MYAAR|nr:hypothetical protein MAR_004633 [Mya arenaria]
MEYKKNLNLEFIVCAFLVTASVAQPFPPQGGQFQPIPASNQNIQSGQPTNQNMQPMQPTNQNMQPTQTANQNGQLQIQSTNPVQDTQELSPEEQSQISCAQAGRAVVSQCFQQNGGFEMLTVIALLSNGTQSPLPPNPESVRQNLCQANRQIVACVFASIERYNGSQECSTESSYTRLKQETVGLLNGVQQMCGQGLMPEVTPCMQRLNYDLLQCVPEVGLNPDLYTGRGSRMEGAIIGDNREVARMFCDKRKDLFECQQRVLARCQGSRLLQQLSVYVSGLVCFQTPTKEVNRCAASLVSDMTDVTIKQIRDDLDTPAFFREYCKVRIGNLQCDSRAWSNVCNKTAVNLKSEYQCNVLPPQCKNDSSIQALYEQTCAAKNFAREQSVSGSGSEPGTDYKGIIYPGTDYKGLTI